MFVACQVLIERLPSRDTRLLQFNDDERQAVHETDQIRPASIKITRDRHLADEQKVVGQRVLPIDYSYPLRLLSSALTIGNRDFNAISHQLPNLAVRPGETHRRPVACKLIDCRTDRVGR